MNINNAKQYNSLNIIICSFLSPGLCYFESLIVTENNAIHLMLFTEFIALWKPHSDRQQHKTENITYLLSTGEIWHYDGNCVSNLKHMLHLQTL